MALRGIKTFSTQTKVNDLIGWNYSCLS